MQLHIIFHVQLKYILHQKYQLIDQSHYNTIIKLKAINSNLFHLELLIMVKDISIMSMNKCILLKLVKLLLE